MFKKILIKIINEYFFRLLNETKGSLLDNVELVDTLEVSKQTSKDVTEAVQTAEQTEIKIDATREVILFFVKILEVLLIF